MLLVRPADASSPLPPVARFGPGADASVPRRAPEGVLVALTLVFALVLSSLWLPSLASAASVSGLDEAGVAQACAGQAWGAETLSCVTAIAHAGGRQLPGGLRIVRVAAAS